MSEHEAGPARERAAGPRIRHATLLPRVSATAEAGVFSPEPVHAPSVPGGEEAGSRESHRDGGDREERPERPRTGESRSGSRLVLLKVAVAVLVAVPFAVTLTSSRGIYGRHASNAGRSGDGRPSARRQAAPAPAPSRTSRAPEPAPTPTRTPRASASPSPSPSPSDTMSVRPPARKSSPRPPAERPVTRAAPHTLTRELVSRASGRCIDVPGGKAKDGTPLQIRDCTGRARQRWTFEPDGSLHSLGMCMDVAWGSDEDGAVVQLVRCNGGSAQRFHLHTNGDLVNAGSGKCVDVTDMETANGTRLQQWTCGGTSNQKWRAT